MGKVQILAVLTMDGCLSSELYYKAHQDLCLDRCGLDEIRKNALYRVTPDYSISMLHEWRKDGTNIRYLAEATENIKLFYLIPLSLSLLFSLRLPVWYLRPWLKLKLAVKTSMLPWSARRTLIFCCTYLLKSSSLYTQP